jgi:hypothetical protein
LLVAACPAIAACAPTGAYAGHRIPVLFVPVGEGGTSASERALRRRIDERGDLEMVSVSRLATLAAGGPSGTEAESDAEGRIEQAERRIEQAEDAFSRFDYQGATTQLGEALALLRPLATTESGRRRLASVHLTLAMVLLVHGEREAAVEEVRTCVHLDARCAPDAARHPPELVQLTEEVRADAGPANGVLRVITDPPDARARIDGGGPQPTPAEWSELRPGRHYLTLERDGFVPEVHVVTVSEGERMERAFRLTLGATEERASAAVRQLEGRGVEAEPLWRAQAATLAAADLMVVLSVRSGGLSLAAFDARGAPIGDALTRPGDEPGAAVGWLEQTLPGPTVPWFGQWWFWTPVALGLSVAFGALVWAIVRTPPVQLIGGEVIRE